MKKRIDFRAAATAAEFNKLRDKWREFALGGGTGMRRNRTAALRIAGVLPKYLNRELGYCFPSGEELGAVLNMSDETVKRGLRALETAGLIERQQQPKRNDAGRMVGKNRRIYLTLPEAATSEAPKGHNTEGSTQKPKGQKRPTEGSYGCASILDKNTLDKDSTYMGFKVSAYAYARENVPSAYASDSEFLNSFDEAIIRMTSGREIGAGEMEKIVQTAFDETTDSDRDLFMPFHWRDVCRLREPETADWFRARAGQLFKNGEQMSQLQKFKEPAGLSR